MTTRLGAVRLPAPYKTYDHRQMTMLVDTLERQLDELRNQLNIIIDNSNTSGSGGSGGGDIYTAVTTTYTNLTDADFPTSLLLTTLGESGYYHVVVLLTIDGVASDFIIGSYGTLSTPTHCTITENLSGTYVADGSGSVFTWDGGIIIPEVPEAYSPRTVTLRYTAAIDAANTVIGLSVAADAVNIHPGATLVAHRVGSL